MIRHARERGRGLVEFVCALVRVWHSSIHLYTPSISAVLDAFIRVFPFFLSLFYFHRGLIFFLFLLPQVWALLDLLRIACLHPEANTHLASTQSFLLLESVLPRALTASQAPDAPMPLQVTTLRLAANLFFSAATRAHVASSSTRATSLIDAASALASNATAHKNVRTSAAALAVNYGTWLSDPTNTTGSASGAVPQSLFAGAAATLALATGTSEDPLQAEVCSNALFFLIYFVPSWDCWCLYFCPSASFTDSHILLLFSASAVLAGTHREICFTFFAFRSPSHVSPPTSYQRWRMVSRLQRSWHSPPRGTCWQPGPVHSRTRCELRNLYQ